MLINITVKIAPENLKTDINIRGGKYNVESWVPKISADEEHTVIQKSIEQVNWVKNASCLATVEKIIYLIVWVF